VEGHPLTSGFQDVERVLEGIGGEYTMGQIPKIFVFEAPEESDGRLGDWRTAGR
jgi:hypothetical protein